MPRNNIIFSKPEVEQLISLKNSLLDKKRIRFQFHPKTSDFLYTNELSTDDLTLAVRELTIKEYCYSRYNNNDNYPKDEIVHIFNTTFFPENLDLYIKFKITNSLVVISFHELEYKITHPY